MPFGPMLAALAPVAGKALGGGGGGILGGLLGGFLGGGKTQQTVSQATSTSIAFNPVIVASTGGEIAPSSSGTATGGATAPASAVQSQPISPFSAPAGPGTLPVSGVNGLDDVAVGSGGFGALLGDPIVLAIGAAAVAAFFIFGGK